jgi:hypothetical protein
MGCYPIQLHYEQEGTLRLLYCSLPLPQIHHESIGVGFSQANRREARKLGLLHAYAKVPKTNASECKPLERMSVFAGNIPTQILIPYRLLPGTKNLD